MSTKGQVVIPKAARDALALKPGAYLSVGVDGGRIVLTPDRQGMRLSMDEFYSRTSVLMAGRPVLTPEEIDEAVATMFSDDAIPTDMDPDQS